MDKHCAVAIDGPSGAGKSTLARAAADRFGFIYVDTGAIYRTVGLAVGREARDPGDVDQVCELLPRLDIRLVHDGEGLQRMLLCGEDVSKSIRTPEISQLASKVSALPEVRAFLMDMQRSMAERNNVIMDGRDIGTVVLPSAEVKVFLTASPEARAERRCRELEQRGLNASFEEILREMKERDERDSHRAAAPLKAAEDAILLDTTHLTLPESLEQVCNIIRGSWEA